MEIFTKRKTESAERRKDDIKFVGEFDRNSFVHFPLINDSPYPIAIKKEEDPILFQYNYSAKQKGVLKVTPFYLRINNLPGKIVFDPIHIFLGDIDQIKIIPLSKNLTVTNLIDCKIDCKTFQRIHLFQVKPSVMDSLKENAQFNGQLRKYPACLLKEALPSVDKIFPSWKTSYFGELPEEKEALEKSNWRVDGTSNEEYKLCETYPRQLVVPLKSTETLLKQASGHRTRERIPVLSWLNNNNSAAICRSSQPRTGLTNRRSSDDDTVLNNILTTSLTDFPVDGKLIIFDARPRLNATVCHATGGGVETFASKYSYCGIENIHEVRKSHNRLRKLCLEFHRNKNRPKESFLDEIEKTGWPKHIKTILKASVKAAQCVRSGSTVLVHCSDGWDRTAQLTSLMIIFLDPSFRTLQGFMKLIEREWCSTGHRFATRLGQGVLLNGEEERAPIFLQFIECVWRIQQQHPRLFEFNEDFLITLLLHSYSCCFGNFLFDSEKERFVNQIFSSTFSLWDYMASHEKRFRNPLYSRDYDGSVLLHSTPSIWHVRPTPFWKRWFLFYQRNFEMPFGTLPDLDKELGLL